MLRASLAVVGEDSRESEDTDLGTKAVATTAKTTISNTRSFI
jgi:hypothetical protein